MQARADYTCPQRGGEGAVRGAVEKILRGDGRWNDAVKKGVSGGIVTLNLRAAVGVDALSLRGRMSIRPYGLTEGDFMKNKKHTPLLAALATLCRAAGGRGA